MAALLEPGRDPTANHASYGSVHVLMVDDGINGELEERVRER